MKISGIILAVLSVCLLSCGATSATQQSTAMEGSAASEANAAFDAKDWAKSAELYERMTQAHPETPRLWYRLGASLQGLGQFDKAIGAYKQGVAAGLPPIYGEYAIATAYAQMKDREKAFEFLQEAMAKGYNQPEQLAGDERLVELRSDARFAKLVEQAKHNLKPCADTAENRQFDYWLGEWNVETTQGGVPSGQSRIELILGDCVVQENWQSNGNPYSGKSYNIYNAALKRWEQYWVDNVGGNIFFYGGLKDGVMGYWTDELPQPDGTKLKRHLRFFKLGPDKVRQYSQGSTDNGKTWRDEYDFTYNRKK